MAKTTQEKNPFILFNSEKTDKERAITKEICSKGGKARQLQVAKDKSLKNITNVLLQSTISTDVAKKYCGELLDNAKEAEITFAELLQVRMFQEVLENGNCKAAEFIRDTSGQSPKTELTLNGNLDVLTASDKAILAKIREKLPNLGQNDEESES